ncbi:MAG: hypothetical protein QOG43_3579 [Actinomycetota bacterium]|jgi:hypothetical protein|nr:hypothetical protein [Actinomycetota bacterium]
MTSRKNKLIIAAAGLALAAGLAGGGVAVAGSGEDGPSVTGPEADAATAAALAATGGGHANAVERDSENGAVWEVEVAKADGTTDDVRLDGSYRVVVIAGDSETAGAADTGSQD